MSSDSKSNLPEGANRLHHEESPYLKQHATNPVEWYPWGEEAFDIALSQNKPVFLSIGYSSCHWCHVMARESFEDNEVAEILNEGFISIKVDREERPDVDNLYMSACNMLTGSGGWPLTIIMTPDKKPFYAATYLPKQDRFGQTGLITLLNKIQSLWKEKIEELKDIGNKLHQALDQTSGGYQGEFLDPEILDKTFQHIRFTFDSEYGGFGNAPKFPSPHILLYLLQYYHSTKNQDAIAMVIRTLTKMRMGGIFDQVGFGFHRYSTDAMWIVPHFEKMLYDQAMLSIAYTDAYRATQNPLFKQTVQEILSYVLKELKRPMEGFLSAQNAESEGEEGKYYLWKKQEIKQMLSAEEAELIFKVFPLFSQGNFVDPITGQKNGENILYIGESFENVARDLSFSEKELKENLKKALDKLYLTRRSRVLPETDDKILTDWNGLMITALAKAGAAFSNEEYIEHAYEAAKFILNKCTNEDGALLHRFSKGDASVPGFLDDYMFMVNGLIEIYQTTFNTAYLKEAIGLMEYTLDHFWDPKEGGFFFTSDQSEDLLVRKKEIFDGAIPSGNSIAIHNLIKLGRLLGKPSYIDKAKITIQSFSKVLERSPASFTSAISAFHLLNNHFYEIVISGNLEDKETGEMIKILQKQYHPDCVIVLNPSNENSPEIHKIAPYTKSTPPINGKSTAYICTENQCKEPTTDRKTLIKIISPS